MTNDNDITGKAVKDFLAEAEEIIDRLSNDLVGLSDYSDSGECSPDLINSIFRGCHSLKGLAGMFGFSDISDLAHNLENLLDSLRLGKIILSQAVLSVLFDSMDLLATLVREAGEGMGGEHDIARTMERINSCTTCAPPAKGESLLAGLDISPRVLSTLTEYEEHRLLENIRKGRKIHSVCASFSLETFDQDLAELTEFLKSCGEVISTLPSAGGSIGLTIDFEILFGSEKGAAEITSLVDRENVVVVEMGSTVGTGHALPRQTEGDAEPEPAAEQAMTAKSFSRTVRVDIGKLDELMNIVGELVLSHSMIADLAVRMGVSGATVHANDLAKLAKTLERRLTELQKGVIDIRMIPVGQLFEKMARIVRKLSREQGKSVELKMYGVNTELDKLIIEDISDPLMHLVRNAIDHGIEPPEERARAGKDEKGTIRLSSYQKGNHVVIEVEDDGMGIDLAKVKRKALEKGLVGSLDGISDREAMDLIFEPGFSTRDEISDISGRGVGMDVVRNNIAAVSGMVDIESSYGCGSRVIITLPITLAIIKALIIASGGRTYAIPITSVLETMMIAASDILTVERKEVIQLRESTLPLVRLADFFAIEGSGERSEGSYVVVIGVAEKRLGILVDDLHCQQDIVIKSIGETFKRCRGISGAADMGDQRTILVLDAGGIISEATRGNG
ncbi:MAG TPA: chemotaxis protein CheA [Geobacteraceae bacterium]|nr:chemotaxis protein CheA [Geobacteraceae bacterium]